MYRASECPGALRSGPNYAEVEAGPGYQAAAVVQSCQSEADRHLCCVLLRLSATGGTTPSDVSRSLHDLQCNVLFTYVFKPQWLLYVPPGLNLIFQRVFPRSVVTVLILRMSLSNINRLAVMKQQCALCEVRTDYLSTIQTNFSFRRLTPDVTFFACEGC